MAEIAGGKRRTPTALDPAGSPAIAPGTTAVASSTCVQWMLLRGWTQCQRFGSERLPPVSAKNAGIVEYSFLEFRDSPGRVAVQTDPTAAPTRAGGGEASTCRDTGVGPFSPPAGVRGNNSTQGLRPVRLLEGITERHRACPPGFAREFGPFSHEAYLWNSWREESMVAGSASQGGASARTARLPLARLHSHTGRSVPENIVRDLGHVVGIRWGRSERGPPADLAGR